MNEKKKLFDHCKTSSRDSNWIGMEIAIQRYAHLCYFHERCSLLEIWMNKGAVEWNRREREENLVKIKKNEHVFRAEQQHTEIR